MISGSMNGPFVFGTFQTEDNSDTDIGALCFDQIGSSHLSRNTPDTTTNYSYISRIVYLWLFVIDVSLLHEVTESMLSYAA